MNIWDRIKLALNRKPQMPIIKADEVRETQPQVTRKPRRPRKKKENKNDTNTKTN